MSTSSYQSIINLNRFNIQLTPDVVRLLDSLVTTFNKTFLQVDPEGIGR